MIPVHRPEAEATLSAGTRTALSKRHEAVVGLAANHPDIERSWANFLKSKPRRDVSAALDGFSRRKCAYCEAIVALDIEHFYPKSLYPARMFIWDNLLRGCKNCNTYKRDTFPLTAMGDPRLLDPCRDEPLDFIAWDFVTGAVVIRPEPGFEERARETRDLLHLDAEPLRTERREKLRTVIFLLAQIVREALVSTEAVERLQAELDPCRPWLGIVRQLFHRPSQYAPLVQAARERLPPLTSWVAALG